jgi:hypothetical protein
LYQLHHKNITVETVKQKNFKNQKYPIFIGNSYINLGSFMIRNLEMTRVKERQDNKTGKFYIQKKIRQRMCEVSSAKNQGSAIPLLEIE